MESPDYSLDEILDWLNAERKRLGFNNSLETIPKGVLGKMLACSCPISIGLSSSGKPDALNAIVDGDNYWPEFKDMRGGEFPKNVRPLPEKVRMFITDWDAGHYPELVTDG